MCFARVELKDVADPERSAVYEKLHVALKERGFRRTFLSGRKWLRMPEGEYVALDVASAQVAREVVSDAVAAIGHRAGSRCLVNLSPRPNVAWVLKAIPEEEAELL